MQRGTHGRGLFGTFERERKRDHSLDLQGRCKYDSEDHGRSGTESFPTFTVVLGRSDLWTDLFADSKRAESDPCCALAGLCRSCCCCFSVTVEAEGAVHRVHRPIRMARQLAHIELTVTATSASQTQSISLTLTVQ